ncbi:MAG: hypothetical protein VYC12_07155 [Candidatus Thermoplasmatota archaeon]|nr:hypothetical protein [Candidatus Thermoplasmatota archaeon]
MGASVGIGGLIVGTSMLVVLALAVNAVDLRLESSLETIESANELSPTFTIDNADIALGAVTALQLDDPGTGYVNGTLSATGGGGSGFSGTFTVNNSGAIMSWSITNHGDYSSDPTIVIDGPQPGGVNGSFSVVARTTVVDVTITNTGSVIVPVNEVWMFLDGENARNLGKLAPITDSQTIFPGDTVEVIWRGHANNVFEVAALSCNGFNTARVLV